MPLALIVVLVALLAGCVAGPGSLGAPEPASPESTPVPSPTIDPRPTQTPEPTATPEATQIPTATPTPIATPEASPTSTPDPNPFTRLVIGDVGLGDRWQISVEVLDRSHNVVRGYPANDDAMADAPWPQGGNDPVAWNPGGDRHRLAVLWVGGICELPALLALDAGRATLRTWYDTRGCDAIGLGRAVVLELSAPVDASTLKIAIANPDEPDGCPTGDEIGPWVRSLERPGRLGSVVLQDQPGIIGYRERFGPASPTDSIGLFGDFDPDHGIVAGKAGGTSVLTTMEPTFRIAHLDVLLFDRASVVAGQPDELRRWAVEPDERGRIVIDHPDSGRYVFALLADWEHACFTGESVWYASLDIA